MLSLKNLTVRHEPFVMGIATEVFEPETYQELAANFPPLMLAKRCGTDKHGLKFSLAEEFEKKRYFQFLSAVPIWQKFYNYTQSDDFFNNVFAAMDYNKIAIPPGGYCSRFEFSFIPAAGGTVTPHRDAPPKVIAFVIPFTPQWRPEWGGSTDMLETDVEADDYEIPREDFRPIMEAPFIPNSANFLKRSANSWHAVNCHGPADVFRQSITLNVVDQRYAN
jgi:hypothetical protein